MLRSQTPLLHIQFHWCENPHVKEQAKKELKWEQGAECQALHWIIQIQAVVLARQKKKKSHTPASFKIKGQGRIKGKDNTSLKQRLLSAVPIPQLPIMFYYSKSTGAGVSQ